MSVPIAYDGRYSADCETNCAEGACGQPSLPGMACGSCCGCLGGCPLGYGEQMAEAAERAAASLARLTTEENTQ